MKRLLWQLWRDEQGLVNSIELVFSASIIAIGMIVGLSAYRDGVIDELADNARAVGQVNQSYSIQVLSSGPVNTTTSQTTITGVVDGSVTIDANYGTTSGGIFTPLVKVQSGFNNFSYTDLADFCDNAPIQRVSAAGVTEATAPPAPLP